MKLLKAAVKTSIVLNSCAVAWDDLCHWWYTDSWLHYPQRFTHDFLQGDFKKRKKSHFKESISFIAVAQWKRPLLKYGVTLGPFFVLPPNQTQLAGKCSTKTLLEVSHQLRYDFYLRTAQCVHTWDVFRDDVPWDRATLRTFPADRMGSVKPDLNRLWLRGLVQH